MRTVTVDGLDIGPGHPTRVMGVLNMSVESNYDPSVHGEPDDAVAHAERMVENGVDIVDVGLQSANPKNDWRSPETELERLEKAIRVRDQADVDAVWSIETRFSEVAEAAIAGGYDLVNDVCGFADPDMPGVCEDHDVPVVKMASPPDLKKPGHLRTVEEAFEAIQRGGFTDRTILDPAFGGWFAGRTHEDNYRLFERLREFRALGRPLLTATNREDFLGVIADRPDTAEQLPVSLAAATMEAERGADVIRTHDVPETADVAAVADHLGDTASVATDPRVVEVPGLEDGELARHGAVRSVVAGDTDAGTPGRGFFVDYGTPDAREALAAVARDHDLTVTADEELAFLAGRTDAVSAALPAIEAGPAPLPGVAANLRTLL